MSERRHIQKVQYAINDAFSALKDDPWLAQRVLTRARGEGVVVKKKLSVGLVLIIVLILAAVTALAALVFTWDDAAKYLRKELQQGKFDVWSGAERTELIASLAEAGAIGQSPELDSLLSGKLSEEEASALAERLMTEWLNAPVDHVAFRPIMEKLWGEFFSWTLEQKAWFSDTLIEAGIQKPDLERYVLPGEDVLSAEEAVQIARTYSELWAGAAPNAFEKRDIVCEYIIFPRRSEATGRYTTDRGS